jgi:hypothetical protein
LESTNLFLPVSKAPRLTRVMQQLIEKPDSQENLESLAKRSGASLRTLARQVPKARSRCRERPYAAAAPPVVGSPPRRLRVAEAAR